MRRYEDRGLARAGSGRRALGAVVALAAAVPMLVGSSACGAATHPSGFAPHAPVPTVPLSAHVPHDAAAGQWTYGSLTVRSTAPRAKLGLWFGQGKGPDNSTRAQRYDARAHRWTDVGLGGGTGFFPAPPPSRQPVTVGLRIMPHDAVGLIDFSASYDDGHRPAYYTRDRSIAVAAPRVSTSGLRQGGTPVLRGGPPVAFTVSVHNGTRYAYPGVRLRYDGLAWDSRAGSAASYRGLHLQSYAHGHWVTETLAPAKDGFTVSFAPRDGARLAPGATAAYRLRVWADRTLPARTSEIDGAFVATGPSNLWAAKGLGNFTTRVR